MEIGEHILFLCEGKAEWEGTKDEIVSSDNEKLNSFIFASDLFRKVKDVELDQQEKIKILHIVSVIVEEAADPV